MLKRVLFWIISFTLCVSGSLYADTLTFGVVPQQSAKKLASLWTPIFTYLSEKTGDDIHFVTASDIPTFEQRLLAGEYDLAYMNPYHFIVFNQSPGYLALAKQKDHRLKGIIVVKKDSPIQSLKELEGMKLAFPSPAAFAATVIPQAQLELENIGFTSQYVSSHDSVYMGVARGFFNAGGGVQRTFNNTDPAIREQLRVLWTSIGFTPHAFAVHPRVSDAAKLRLQTAMVAMSTDPEGIALLENINFSGIEAATDSDWDDIKSLKLKTLDHLLE